MTSHHTHSQTHTHKTFHLFTPLCTRRLHPSTYRCKHNHRRTHSHPPLLHAVIHPHPHPRTHTSPSAPTSSSSLTRLSFQTRCLSLQHALFPRPRGVLLSQVTTSHSPSSPSTNRSPDIRAACQPACRTLSHPHAPPLLTADWEAGQDSVQRIAGPPSER